MDDYDRLCLLAQHMRYHEHAATLLPRGRERDNHNELAAQYRDQILGNAKSCNTNTRNHSTEK